MPLGGTWDDENKHDLSLWNVSHGAEVAVGCRGRISLVLEARLGVWPGRRYVPGIVVPLVGEHAEQIVMLLDVPRRPTSWRCAMDTLFVRVAGLDVHLKVIQCAIRCRQESGKLFSQVRSYGTMTRDLRALAGYLQQMGVTHVAMEATGVYWKPIWNVLEGPFTLLLVNPRHLKKVPGRKTDVTDAEWLAQLLQCGLLRGSFVPPRSLRNLRDLTRHRAQLTGEHTRVANRIHKVLEDANIKLGQWRPTCWASPGGRCCGPCSTAKRTPTSLRTWRWVRCAPRYRNCGWPWKATARSIIAMCWANS